MLSFVSFHRSKLLDSQLIQVLRHWRRWNRVRRHEGHRREEERRRHSRALHRKHWRSCNRCSRGRSSCWCLMIAQTLVQEIQEWILLSGNCGFIWSCILISIVVDQRLLLRLRYWCAKNIQTAGRTRLLSLEPWPETLACYWMYKEDNKRLTSSIKYGKCDRRAVFSNCWSYPL